VKYAVTKDHVKTGVLWYLYIAGAVGVIGLVFWFALQPPALDPGQDYLLGEIQRLEREIDAEAPEANAQKQD